MSNTDTVAESGEKKSDHIDENHDDYPDVDDGIIYHEEVLTMRVKLATKITRTTAGAFFSARCSSTSATRTNRTRSDS